MKRGGTSSFGKHNKITHIRCRRCGHHSFNIRTGKCSYCGYSDKKIKSENWKWKKPLSKKRRK